MPRKLAIIEIETGEDERLCGRECPKLSAGSEGCQEFDVHLALEHNRFLRCPACLESTRLASLDRAVVEAAECYVAAPTPHPLAWLDLKTAAEERRKANG